MTSRIPPAVAGLFAWAAWVGIAAGDDPKADNGVREELKRLEGEWRVAAAEGDGEAFESKSVVRFAGGRCTITDPGSGLPALELTLAIDPSKGPKWMDVTNARKATHRGIYELDGDSLKAVFRPDETGGRPTKFETKKGGGLVMYTYERVKPSTP